MRCLRSLPCRRHQALTWRESPSPWWLVQPSASQCGSREPPPVRPRRQNPCGPKMAGWPSQTAGHTPSPKWDTGHTAKRPRAKALLAGRTTHRVQQQRGTAGAHRSTAKSHSRTDLQNNIWTKPGPLRYDWEKSISFDFCCVLSFEQEDLVNPTTRLLVSLSFNSYIYSKALKCIFMKLCFPVAMETPRFCLLVFRRSRDNLHLGPQSWERHSTHADGPKYGVTLTWVGL